ncbi:MAG: hypothetical protein COC24_010885 [Alphaproteobacteria bacterium]|nr:hypothetical protein [Alphaproteobacteria bacterium]
MSELPIACNPNALTNDQRQWLTTEFRKLFNMTEKVKALPTGYGFHFKNVDEQQFTHIAKLIALDRLCCPFIQHEIIQPAGGLDVWLHFSAAKDIKTYLECDITQLVGKQAKVITMMQQQNTEQNHNICLCSA